LQKPLHFFLVYTACFIFALVLLRAVVFASEEATRVTNKWQKQRLRESFAHLDKVRRRVPLVLLAGASEMQTGFSPEPFERSLSKRGHRVYAMNMAVDNMGRWMPLYLARLEDELKRTGLRPRVLFLQFPPSSMTTKSRRLELTQWRLFDFPAVLYNPRVLMNFDSDLEEKTVAFFNKYILGERSLLQVVRFFSPRFPRERSVAGRNRAALWFEARHHPYPAWDPAQKGFFYFNIEQYNREMKKYFRNMQTPEAVQETIDKYEECCDFLNLNIDQPHLERLTEWVKRLALLSHKVVLIQMAENPYFTRSPESLARLNSALHSIAAPAGAEVWTLDEDPFKPEDFIDITHLSPKGVRYFSRRLADRIPDEWFAPSDQN